MSIIRGLAVIGALVVGLITPVGSAHAAPMPDTIAPRFELGFSGWNRASSPQIVDIDGDGVADIVFGSEDGYLRVIDASGQPLPGWPREARIGGTRTAIDSTAGVDDLDQDGRPEIVIGVGSTFEPHQQGGVIVFDANGATRCTYRTGDVFDIWTGNPFPDGYSDGVYSSPALGDVDGDGYNDIVFGSFDHRVYAIDRNCRLVRGFPIDVTDTVWSSPALYDIDRDGRQEIFIGADFYANGPGDPAAGGRFRRFDWGSGRVTTTWTRAAGDVHSSSASIGDINGDGRLEAVIGAGDFFHHPDRNKVFAYHLDNGSTVPGWPQTMTGITGTAPALGDVTGDGTPEVIVATRDGVAHAYRGNGMRLWRNPLTGFGNSASPIVADLDGDGDQDVGVGDGFQFNLLRGHDGANIGAINRVRSFETAGAVGVFGNAGRMLVTIGFDTPNRTTRLRATPLAATTAVDEWPSFGRNVRNLRAAPSDPVVEPQCHSRASRRSPSRRTSPFRNGPALAVDGTFDLAAPTNLDGDGRCDVVLYGRSAAADAQLRLDDSGIPEIATPALGGLGDAIVPLDSAGDGYGDLLIYAHGPASDYLRQGSPFGFRNGPRVTFGDRHDFALPGDFNGDGRGDVLFYGKGSRPDAVWLGTTRGLVLGPSISLKTSFDLVVSGDFNGDRYTDVLFYQRGSDGEILKLGTVYGVFRNGRAPSIATSFDALVAGDFNGDGYDDLVSYRRGVAGDTLRRGGVNGLGAARSIVLSGVFDHLVAGDLDGDLRTDLVGIGNATAPDRIFLGN